MPRGSDVQIGILVKNESNLRDECEKEMRKVTGSEASRIAAAGKTWRLVDAIGMQSTAGNRSYSICQVGRRPTSWLALEFTFAPKKASHLDTISIVIFEDFQDERHVPLLRAEWDLLYCGDKSTPHAQPHWHVYGPALDAVGDDSIDVGFSQTVQGFDREQPLREFDIEDKSEHLLPSPNAPVKPVPKEEIGIGDKFARVHLPMCATWHLPGTGHHLQILDEKQVARWLYECINYVIDELVYADRPQ